MVVSDDTRIDTDSEWDLCDDFPKETEIEMLDEDEDEIYKHNDLLSESEESLNANSTVIKKEKTTDPEKKKDTPSVHDTASNASNVPQSGIIQAPSKAAPSGDDLNPPGHEHLVFWPETASSSSLPVGSDTTTYPEGDALRLTLANMNVCTPPSQLSKSWLLALTNRFTKEQVRRFIPHPALNFNYPLPYFVGGSFMFPATFRTLTDDMSLRQAAQNMCPATLKGYERRCIKGKEYPAIVKSDRGDAVLHGMIVFGISASQRYKIHRLESGVGHLEHSTAQLELQDGSVWNHRVVLYVWDASSEDQLVSRTGKEWSPDMLLGSSLHFETTETTAQEEKKLAEELEQEQRGTRNKLGGDW